jgi:cell division protein FtsW
VRECADGIDAVKSQKSREERGARRVLNIDCDCRILLITLVFIGIGASLVASSSSFFARELFDDHFALMRKHVFKIAIALVAMVLAINIDYRIYRRISPMFLLVGIGMLVGLFIMPGSIRETDRWYYSSRLQMALQPSEVARMALVFFLAWWIAGKGKQITDFKRGFLPAAVAICAVVGLVASTPNYGSALATLIIAMTVLFVGGARIAHLAGFTVAGLFVGALALMRAEYARARIVAFLNPGDGSTELNWQVHQSLIGLGSGGVLGRGLGESSQKLSWLPDSYTDFIFSILGEEAGLVGTILVSSMFLLLALRALKVSRRCSDTFGEMLVVGIGCSIFWYAMLNMYVATGMFPVTGLPLPFLSYGGSALVVNAFAIGVLLNVSRHRAERDARTARNTRRRTALAVGDL